jgi:hypothetical protein
LANFPFDSNKPFQSFGKPLQWIKTRGVSHLVALPFTLKSIFLRQKKNYEKLKYFTMQKYNLSKKSSKQNQNPSR